MEEAVHYYHIEMGRTFKECCCIGYHPIDLFMRKGALTIRDGELGTIYRHHFASGRSKCVSVFSLATAKVKDTQRPCTGRCRKEFANKRARIAPPKTLGDGIAFIIAAV